MSDPMSEHSTHNVPNLGLSALGFLESKQPVLDRDRLNAADGICLPSWQNPLLEVTLVSHSRRVGLRYFGLPCILGHFVEQVVLNQAAECHFLNANSRGFIVDVDS